MKKLIIILSLSLCSTLLMAKLPVNIGIHGGVTYTKLKITDFTSSITNTKLKAHSGYMLGAFARLNISNLYIEPALNFSKKEGQYGDAVIKYNSFDIPLMVGVYALDLPIVKLRAYLGPVASFNGKMKANDFQNELFDNEKTMWSGKIGVGADVWKLTLDVDYEKGLKNFQNNSEIKIKAPSIFNVTLGIKII